MPGAALFLSPGKGNDVCWIIAREKDAVSFHLMKIIPEKIGMLGHIQFQFCIK
jgi:hypothetical protein